MNEVCGACKSPIAPYRMKSPRDDHVTTFWLHSEGSAVGPHRAVLGTMTPLEMPSSKQPEVDEPKKIVYPAPEVKNRAAGEDEIPRGAQLLMNAASRAGWTTGATYARGTPITQGGPVREVDKIPKLDPETGRYVRTKTGKIAHSEVPGDLVVVDSVAVRFYNAGSVRAVAVWEDGKMTCAYRLGPVERVTVPELRKMFRGEES